MRAAHRCRQIGRVNTAPDLYMRWLHDCTEAAQELHGCVKQVKSHKVQSCRILSSALAAVMSLEQAVLVGCLANSRIQELPDLIAEAMSTIELAKSTVQVLRVLLESHNVLKLTFFCVTLPVHKTLQGPIYKHTANHLAIQLPELRGLQVYSSWQFAACTCLSLDHKADSKFEEIADSLTCIARRAKQLQSTLQQEENHSQA